MIRAIHIGRKVPKGWVELPGAMHLGRGIWMIPMEPEKQPVPFPEVDRGVPETPKGTPLK